MQLPTDLRAATTQLLEGVSRRQLGERSTRISENYRSGGISMHGVRDAEDALAYAIARMPATYAVTRNALSRLQERSPHFAPQTALDLGSGPGTASWAIVDTWPTLATFVQMDHNQPMLHLGRQLAATSSSPALRNLRQITGDLARDPIEGSYDLVVLSYTLAELNTTQREAVLRKAWQASTGALVLVEPGTPAGYDRILHARELLPTQGASILAPCPHQLRCPLLKPDWCHFAQRVSRTRDHLLLKSAALSYEDEKFSYLILAREPLFHSAQKGRILAAPQIDKAGFTARLCTLHGTAETIQIRKRDKEQFAVARKTDWGDEL